MKNETDNSNKTKSLPRYIKWFWSAFVGSIVFGVLLLTLLATGLIGYIPSYQDIINPSDKYATRIFSTDMKEIGKFYYDGTNRTYTPYDSLSPALVNALIATEDIRFRKHSGIDFQGLARVVVKGLFLGNRSAGGGSTITQQLAKLLYTQKRSDRIIGRSFQKLNEWIIAVQLERFFTKEEILSMYLNQFDFLYNAIGIETAAKVYFSKTAKDLSIVESAVLVGMCKNPSYFNPKKFPKNSLGRRNVVLDQMAKAKFITKAMCESLKKEPIVLRYASADFKNDAAPYLREYLRRIMSATKPERSQYSKAYLYQYSADSVQWETNPLFGWLNKNLKPDGTKYNLYTDGLRIYSTVDSRMQEYAEKAVVDHLAKELQPAFNKENRYSKYAPYDKNIGETDEERFAKIKRLLENAMRYSERYTRLKSQGVKEEEIRKIFYTPTHTTLFSWKGDRDTLISPIDSIRYMKFFLRSGLMSMDPESGFVKAYVGGANYNYFMYDMVSRGRRQIGSTIKPFLYTMAMQEGFSPCQKVRNVETTIIDGLGRPWTPNNSKKDNYGDMVTLRWGLAHSNNFISAWVMSNFPPESLVRLLRAVGITSPIDAVPALCLGTPDFSIMELCAAYTIFANRGVYAKPILVTRIEDNNGYKISEFITEHREVIDEKTAYLMTNMLQAVVNEGTGWPLRGDYKIKGPVGGKTGTTNDQSDGWFVGFTPQLVTAVWTGGEDRDIHFDGLYMGAGGKMALPIWGKYMRKVFDNPDLGIDEMHPFERPIGFDMDLNCKEVGNVGESKRSNNLEDDLFK